MKFRIQYFGKALLITEESFEFPTMSIVLYPSFCGAGKGAGDKLVPEKMWGLKVSPACDNHDDMWKKSANNFFDFIISNMIFLFNICMLIIVSGSSNFVNFLRINRALLYFTAVSTVGFYFFKKTKRQGKHGVS